MGHVEYPDVLKTSRSCVVKMKKINILCENTTVRTSVSLRISPIVLVKTIHFVIKGSQNRYFPGAKFGPVLGYLRVTISKLLSSMGDVFGMIECKGL